MPNRPKSKRVLVHGKIGGVPTVMPRRRPGTHEKNRNKQPKGYYEQDACVPMTQKQG